MTDDHVSGEFDHPVRCPECSSFMSTGYCPAGLPAAHCRNEACHVDGFGDVWLRRTGNWTETTG